MNDHQLEAVGSLPARQAQLLGLLLDVLVVERCALLGVHLTGAHLDADLLKGRTLIGDLNSSAGLALPDSK